MSELPEKLWMRQVELDDPADVELTDRGDPCGFEYIRADLAAEREQKANDLILKLAMALWSHDPRHSLVQRAKDWLPSCEADTALAKHEQNVSSDT
ncbi:MAG: hypothetical protein FKY71_19490 [Spiribacter salinus]|uniref:Uncharacterized protein n=1 Tax=Spiribacter salinus TaxID=1335746 RepID=A0A540V933_9GAMM|nr:MAG: hypothetical protein FKY71_19490 [Spiribacter salinus]